MKSEFIFYTIEQNSIRADIYSNPEALNNPVIILVHGFKGFKDWGFFPHTAEVLFSKGFNIITFNFSHNGIGKSLTEFDELDKFGKNTISLELSELNQLIDQIAQGKIGELKPEKIGLLGHSRGGAVSILASSFKEKVNSLCCWAPVSNFDRYTERQKSEWRKKGYFEVLNTRTNQIMRMSVDLLEDIEMNKSEKLNIEKATKKLKIPFLIIHGEQDLTVSVKESEQIYNWSDKNLTNLAIIEATGHTFDIIHPFNGSNKKFDKILNLSAEFFLKSLFF